MVTFGETREADLARDSTEGELQGTYRPVTITPRPLSLDAQLIEASKTPPDEGEVDITAWQDVRGG